jgi:hypothetical protein
MYEVLLKEFENNCYFAEDAISWWRFRQEHLKKLTFSEYNDLRKRVGLLIECDNNCC